MRQGFSLVELSIVLVILGLLVGGVLTGQSLIRAAELRSVTTEFEKYQAAVNTFRDKYFQLPGDMNNATSFWGAAHATPATCLTTVGTGTQSCNGDGDGMVEVAAAASQRGEMFAFWHHLASAGLIEGAHSGFAGAGSNQHGVLGTNQPRSKFGNAGWGIVWEGVVSGNATFFDGSYGNLFWFGQSSGSSLVAPVIKPDEAWNIDTKIDDGRASTGSMTAPKNGAYAGCVTGDAVTDTYILGSTGVRCMLFFKSGS